MTPYLDTGFVLTLLMRRDGSPVANAITQSINSPFLLNALHMLQVEGFLMQRRVSRDPNPIAAGQPEKMWIQYLAEGIFVEEHCPWDAAFALARQWNQEERFHPTHPLLVLHPALAVLSEATHFLSFDPRSRAVAHFAGLKLLPEKL